MTSWIFHFCLAEAAAGPAPDGVSEMLARWFWLGAGITTILGIVLLIKKLREGPAAIRPQPLIVALEKEFVHRRDYEKDTTDIQNQLKEGRLYTHDEVHAVRNDIQGLRLKGEGRDEVLHRLDERTITQGRQLSGLDQKMDKLVERVGDKVEQLIRDRRPQNP